MQATSKLIPTVEIWPNDGQIPGLPKNPRTIRDEKFEKLVQSIKEDPEMLNLREVLVYPYAEAFVAVAGNMRLRACIEAGMKEVPCKIIPSDTPVDKLKAIVIKDNIGYGDNDWDALANEWDEQQLVDWGMDIPSFGGSSMEDESDDDDSEDVGVGMGEGESTIIKIIVTVTDKDHVESLKSEIETVAGAYEGTSVTVLGIDNDQQTETE
ncbi:ParB/RepB/Spo0J family partition protein [Parapedobacter indicus]|uniref:ParB-like nuclease domain-containing protein n=1 Tax=Parapedobacter indicus TaxID=1477437 RepID=A0A1I3E1M8_9SPHI|nr:ParB N-terminal domain-containing protein [Parapedobacter indicus]PPL04931.1 ParB-like nuclease family protein [Parapedobacter indicus]SFH92900.1 ParB-like nuclease domain-containing protein [Parapedobacter indicus]